MKRDGVVDASGGETKDQVISDDASEVEGRGEHELAVVPSPVDPAELDRPGSFGL